jgi:hypothetical protein
MKLFNVMFKKVQEFFKPVKPKSEYVQSVDEFIAQASSMGLVPVQVPQASVRYPLAKYASAYRKRYGG